LAPYLILSVAPLCWAGNIVLARGVADIIPPIGAGMIVLRGELKTLLTMSFVQGDLLMVIAVVFYGLYSALLRRRPAIHPLSFLAATFCLGAAGLFPVYLAELATVGPLALGRSTVASILYVAIFPSIVAYFCWNKGVDVVGPNRAGLFINLIPVFASLLSVGLLGESIELFHVGGMAFIIGGMALFYYI